MRKGKCLGEDLEELGVGLGVGEVEVDEKRHENAMVRALIEVRRLYSNRIILKLSISFLIEGK